MSFQSREERDRYIRELRDRAAVAALQGLLAADVDRMVIEQTAVYYAEALVAALYPEEVGDE